MSQQTAPSRTREASDQLADRLHFAHTNEPQLDRGHTLAAPGTVAQGLTFGLADLVYSGTEDNVDNVRAALKAYGQFLLEVAEHAAD